MNEAIHSLDGWIHVLDGSLHDFDGWIDCFDGSIHDFSGSIDCFGESIHCFSGQIDYFDGWIYHSASEMVEIYRNRVRSRLREMFNLIAFDLNTLDKRT